MNAPNQRRPSPLVSVSHGLWGLWDMLDQYASSFVGLMDWLLLAESEIERGVAANPQAVSPPLSPGTALFGAVMHASKLADEIAMPSTKRQSERISQKMNWGDLLTEILPEVRQLRVRVVEELQQKSFLFIDDDWVAYWAKKDIFGAVVQRKHKRAVSDIEAAGSCLAVGQGTACVFHLMRAMEIAVRTLAKRLKVTIVPRTTWRMMTGETDAKIRAMPESTNKEKRKKNDWEAARANLHHVGSVWRNNTMHPATSYTQSQALEVFNAVRVFMNGLCVL